MGNRRRGRSARNSRKNQNNEEPEDIVKAPHSFVINGGKLGKTASELLLNFRKIMQPYTALNLRVLKSNSLKDFINIAGPLNVSHLVLFSKSRGMTLRILKLPHGPTLTFKIQEYSLMRDIVSSQKKPLVYEKLFQQHPLLVLNNFSGEGMHFKLMASTFQNMFPSINVNKTRLNSIRRCLLFNYNSTDNTIDLRHYAIKVVPTGMSRAVKKLIQRKVPNLSNYQEVSDFLQKPGNLSESEYEMDTPANIVTLPQPISSRGNIVSEKSAIRLYELGPRIKMQLVKIEEGLADGGILYHEFKTQEEIKAMTQRIKDEKLLKEKRRAQQQRNVEKKAAAEKTSAEKAAANKGIEGDDSDEHDEDINWYRQEVGDDPDENIFRVVKKAKATINGQRPRKRIKLSESSEECNTSTDINKKKVKFSDDARKHKNHGKLQDSKKGKFSGHSLPFSKKKNVKKNKRRA